MAAKRNRARKSAKRSPTGSTRTTRARRAPEALRIVKEWSRQLAARPSGSLPLQGKAVLITGAARRVGATIARTLQAAGANVMIHYRKSEAEARALARELNSLRGGSAALVSGDLLDVRKLDKLIEVTIKTFGQLDVLINNASTFYPTPVGEITEA